MRESGVMGAPLLCKQEVWVRIPTFPIFWGHTDHVVRSTDCNSAAFGLWRFDSFCPHTLLFAADELSRWPAAHLNEETGTKVDSVAAAQLSPKQ